MALSRNAGDIALASDLGETVLDATLTSLHPYLRWAPAAGARTEAGQLGRISLGLKAEGFATRMDAEPIAGSELPAVRAGVQQARFGLTGQTRWSPSPCITVTPGIEATGRLDAGDAETGAGFELGGGLALADARLGIHFDATGRWLVAHQEDDFSDWGASVSFGVRPRSPRSGLALLAEPVWGSARGGTGAMWRDGFGARPRTPNARGLHPGAGPGPSWSPESFTMNAEYGIAVGAHQSVAPFAEMRLDGGRRHIRFGALLASNRTTASAAPYESTADPAPGGRRTPAVPAAGARSSGFELRLVAQQTPAASVAGTSNYQLGANLSAQRSWGNHGRVRPFAEYLAGHAGSSSLRVGAHLTPPMTGSLHRLPLFLQFFGERYARPGEAPVTRVGIGGGSLLLGGRP